MKKNSISFIGLDQAGKTTIAHYLATEMVEKEFKPTLAVNYSKIIMNKIDWIFCDCPGQSKLRNTWSKCLNVAKFMIFVLDISKAGRFPEAEDELKKVLNNQEVAHLPLLFLFHKTDLDPNNENLNNAKMFFDEDFMAQFGERVIKYFETSIEKPESLDAVKNFMKYHIMELTKVLDSLEKSN